MRNAPSVQHPVGRSRLRHTALALAWSAAALAVVGWGLQSAAPGWRQACACVVLAACALAALRLERASQTGELAWDGAAWRWTPASPPFAPAAEVSLEIALDLQRTVLVRAEPAASAMAGAARWLWLEPTHDRERWSALRRALYSPARHEAQARPQSPAPLT
ncbi:MAG TPA: hypothetical protein VLJ86_13045 [Ramlibacter sp.]|nr:hypothetical protein [Ramlibacter sp.]